MKPTLILLVVVLLLLSILAGCAGPNQFKGTVGEHGRVAGFWLGLWQGSIAPFVFLASLFKSDLSIYEIHNNGAWYNFGYLFGLACFFGGSGNRATRAVKSGTAPGVRHKIIAGEPCIMMENARAVRWSVDAHEEARERKRAETTPLRNEAQLNCVSLRSQLDCEVTYGLSRVKMNAPFGAPLTARKSPSDVYANVGKQIKEGRHVGLDFYDLLLERSLMGFERLTGLIVT